MMDSAAGPALHSPAVVLFRLNDDRVELFGREVFPGLTAAQAQALVDGGWRSLVPREFHAEALRLAGTRGGGDCRSAQFPVLWQGEHLWVRILAAAIPEPDGKTSVFGVVSEVISLRGPSSGPSQGRAPGMPDPRSELRHEISGPLTSIIMQCDMLLEAGCSSSVRAALESILAEAIRVDRLLREYKN